MQYQKYNRGRGHSSKYGRKALSHRNSRMEKSDYEDDVYEAEEYAPPIPPKKKSVTEDPKFIFGIVGGIMFILIIIIASSGGGKEEEGRKMNYYDVDERRVQQLVSEADALADQGGRLLSEAGRVDYEEGKAQATPKYRAALDLLRRARSIWTQVEGMYKAANRELPGNFDSKIRQLESDIHEADKQAGVGD